MAILPFLITLLAVFTVGIENQSSATAGTEDMLVITGSVWYRERMMACMGGMAQEKHFLDAFARTKKFNISGESLAVYDDEEQLILRFESVYLK